LPQQILRNLDGFDNYAIRNHAKQRGRGYFG
jgi:hypothetical protein